MRTGDEGMINTQNELFITDRIKELIKVRGFQVAPAELEGHLLVHPDVADVCVIAAPDEFSGELPFAFVALRDPKLAQDPAAAAHIRTSIMKVRPCPLPTPSFRLIRVNRTRR